MSDVLIVPVHLALASLRPVTVRTALAAVVLALLALVTAPVPASYAAATCQGRTATVEGASGTLTGTEGDDVIAATGDQVTVQALGGNDLVCIAGGSVDGGAGDDTIVSTGPATEFVAASLGAGNDSFTVTGGAESRVTVTDVSSAQVDLGTGDGQVWVEYADVPGTGSLDLGTGDTKLFLLGRTASLDLAAGTAQLDALHLTVAGVEEALAFAATVRMKGSDGRDRLDGGGCDVVVKGGDGRDRLERAGNVFEVPDPPCSAKAFRSVFKGQGGPDRLAGRSGDDVLLGGPGRDVAKGSSGRDRCVAEVERGCER